MTEDELEEKRIIVESRIADAFNSIAISEDDYVNSIVSLAEIMKLARFARNIEEYRIKFGAHQGQTYD